MGCTNENTWIESKCLTLFFMVSDVNSGNEYL